MNSTGIVRRIDELGRVVIPKEIRKTLRINEGDPLEINALENTLTLKKFSPVNSAMQFASCIADSVKEIMGKSIYITDTDVVLCVAGVKKDAVGKQISTHLEKLMYERKNELNSRAKGEKILPIYNGEEIVYDNQIIIPIVSNGDLDGSVVICDKQADKSIDECSVKLCQLLATILSKQFE